MFRFPDRTNLRTESISHRPQESKRFWCLLGSSSVLIHLGLIYWVEISNVHPPRSSAANNATPIDLVELPNAKPARNSSSSSKMSQTSQKSGLDSQPQARITLPPQTYSSTATTFFQPDSSQLDSSSIGVEPEVEPEAEPNTEPEAAPEPIPSNPAAQPQTAPDINPSHFATATPAKPTPEDSLPEDAPLDNPVAASSPEATTAYSEQQPLSTSPENLQPAEGATPQATQNHSEHIERIATATPTPLLSTQPIDVPIPDVSGRLPASEDPGSDLAANVTEQITIPSHLTASLTATSLPPNRGQVLDEAAQPTTEEQTFSSNPAISPCRVTPEVVQFLGKTVAMQVITNEKGQVVHTITQESSHSMAYDELAVCLVKNWSFAPAIARGQPVANDGLVVHITIDRS